jgi:hypothetical protein
MDSGERMPDPGSEGELPIDELSQDPSGYGERMRAKFDAEAAEWVEQEMARRLDERRRNSTGLGRLILGFFGHERAKRVTRHDEPGSAAV